MTVSATEWAASESIALDPLISPATAFATAMPRLATAATMTVNVDSPPADFASLMVGSMSAAGPGMSDARPCGLFSPSGGPGPRPPG